MKERILLRGIILVVILGLVIRLVPIRNNNFYFTMDQADEAVRAREIFYRHQLVLTGQGTSLSGLFHGPFWVWFISLGFFLFSGHPFGALFLLIVINLSITAYIMWQLGKKVSLTVAITVGLALQFFWPFFDTSRFAFSPFPLVALSILTIFLLIGSLEGGKLKYILAAAPVSLAFHTELASFPPLFFIYILVGIFLFFKHRWPLKIIAAGPIMVFMFFIPHLVSELKTNFSQWNAFQNNFNSPDGVFSAMSWAAMTPRFLDHISSSIIPQNKALSLGIFTALTVLFLISKFLKRTFLYRNVFVDRFIILSLLLATVAWVFASSNTGWNPWHTIFIPPIIFVCLLLLIFSLPRKVAIVVFITIFIAQLLIFKERFLEISSPSKDASILANELKAVDWVYQKAEGKGFYVYSYLPSVYDYPYQYLFWWNGLKKYGYVPCEYSTYPGVPDFFVPGLKYYQSPQKECKNIRFLIIEPDKNEYVRKVWLDGTRAGTTLVDEVSVGEIKVEKRTF